MVFPDGGFYEGNFGRTSKGRERLNLMMRVNLSAILIWKNKRKGFTILDGTILTGIYKSNNVNEAKYYRDGSIFKAKL